MLYINDIDVPADGNCLYSAVLIALMNERLLDEENSNSLAAVAQEKLFADIKTKIRSQKGYETFGESAACFKEWYPELLTYSNSYQLLEEIMVPILRGAIADYALGLNEEEEVYQELSDKISLVNLNENVSAKSAAELSDNYQPKALTAEEYKIHFEEVRDKANSHPYGSVAELRVIAAIYGVAVKSVIDENPENNTLYIHNVGEHYNVDLRVLQKESGSDQEKLAQFCRKAISDSFDVDNFISKINNARESLNKKSIQDVIKIIYEVIEFLPENLFKKLLLEKKDNISVVLNNFWISVGITFSHSKEVIGSISRLRGDYEIMQNYKSPFASSPKKIMTALSKSEALENYERCCGDVRDFIANNSDANIDGVLNSVLGAFDNLSLQEKDDNPLLRASNIWLCCAISEDKMGFANAIQKFQEILVEHLDEDEEETVALPTASIVDRPPALVVTDALPACNTRLEPSLRVEIENQIKKYELGGLLEKQKGKFLTALLIAINLPSNGYNTFCSVIQSVKNQKNNRGQEKWPKEIYSAGYTSATVHKLLAKISALDTKLSNTRQATFQPVNSRQNPGSATLSR